MAAQQNRASLKRKITRLAKKLPSHAPMIQGSLIKRFVRCGNPRCKCADGEKHGPAYYLSFKENGVTKMIYIPKDKVNTMTAQINHYKAYKQLGREISQMNKQLLDIQRKSSQNT